MRAWQGPEDKVWEAKRRKVGTVVRSNCWRDSEGAEKRQAPRECSRTQERGFRFNPNEAENRGVRKGYSSQEWLPKEAEGARDKTEVQSPEEVGSAVLPLGKCSEHSTGGVPFRGCTFC